MNEHEAAGRPTASQSRGDRKADCGCLAWMNADGSVGFRPCGEHDRSRNGILGLLPVPASALRRAIAPTPTAGASK